MERLSRIALPGLVARLVEDGRALVRAELVLARTRVTTRIAAARSGVVLLLAAALVALLALIGLVVGLVMALAVLVGPGLAGLIVLLVGLVIAAALGWIGSKQLSTRPKAAAEALPPREVGHER